MYEELLTLSETEDISDFFAPYHGAVNCITDEASSDTIHHIVLSDLTVNYERPCVIDIKIGRFTYEPSVDASKKQREKLKYIYQEEIGFRITGLKVFDGVENNYLVTNKQFGRSLLPSQVLHGLALFFLYSTNRLRFDIIQIVLRKLHKILTWMRAQTKYQFYCSSILIIYASAEIAGTAETVSSNAEVRMIDLAHTMSEEGVLDEGYIHGLRNLITYLEQLLPRDSEQEMQAQCEHSWNLLDVPELSIGIERLSF